MESLLELDRQLLVAVNGWHSPAADAVMLFFSGIWNWVPLYVLIAALMFSPRWWSANPFVQGLRPAVPVWGIGLVSLLAVAACFGLTDQVTNLIKDTVCRLRPSHEPLLAGVVRLPEGAGGLYGFSSGHAANTVSLALLTSLMCRRRWYSIVIFIWSAVICYSRMYLGKHYPGDVLAGVLLGLLVAYVIFSLWVVSLDRLKKRYALSDR